MKDPRRAAWNERQKALRPALNDADQFSQAINQFMIQHTWVHAGDNAEEATFADEVWDDLNEDVFRRIPRNEEHSVAWVIWHIARIEDVTMNMLIAGEPQRWYSDGWPDRVGTTIPHTGNAMEPEAFAALSAALDMDGLRAYRAAVAQQTRAIVADLTPEALKQKVDPARLQTVLDAGAVVDAARGIVDYWGRRTIAGLLLMPPTRHNFIHLNEALKLKHKRL